VISLFFPSITESTVVRNSSQDSWLSERARDADIDIDIDIDIHFHIDDDMPWLLEGETPEATPRGGPPYTRLKEPLKLSGALDGVECSDITPLLGREYPKAKLVEWMNAPNADELIRDLAITGKSASQREPKAIPWNH
jgi:hypothetical protein